MKIFQNDIVGYIGEKYTANLFKKNCTGFIFTDVYVNGSHGVQQIDIIAVTPKGVIVIEKKTYIGLIVGRAYDKQWKIYTGRGKQKFSMKNPHHQNYGHIQALLENFPQMKDKTIDLVVFGNNAKLGEGIPNGTICDANINEFYKRLPNILDSQQIKCFAQLITELNLNRATNKRIHKKKIRKIKKSYKF